LLKRKKEYIEYRPKIKQGNGVVFAFKEHRDAGVYAELDEVRKRISIEIKHGEK